MGGHSPVPLSQLVPLNQLVPRSRLARGHALTWARTSGRGKGVGCDAEGLRGRSLCRMSGGWVARVRVGPRAPEPGGSEPDSRRGGDGDPTAAPGSPWRPAGPRGLPKQCRGAPGPALFRGVRRCPPQAKPLWAPIAPR